MKLAARIALGPGERFGGSAKVGDGHGDATAVMARVDGPSGPRLRFGVVAPDDVGRWTAANKGRTVELDATGATRLRDVLASAAADGKKSVAEYRAALHAAKAAGRPESDWPDVEADVASGVIKGARWGDLRWKLSREFGQGDNAEWNLALDPAPTGATGLRDNFDATTAATASKLGKAISNLFGTTGG